jgi:gas vesicle protein
MEQEESATKGFLIGFLAGGLIGAAVALLYAPKSGKELRAEIKNKAGEIADDAEQYLTAAKHKAVDIINEGKKKSDQLISDAREKAQTLLTDAERILTDAREKAGVVMEEGSRIKSAVKAGVNAFKGERSRS